MSWETLAFAARYGRQPLSELRDLTRREFSAFLDALTALVERENHPRPE